MTYHLAVDYVDLKNKSPLARHVFIKIIWLSMVSVFLPAILRFEYGLSLTQLFLYEAFFSCIVLLVVYFSSLSFTARHGTVASMLLGVCFFIVSFVFLYFAKHQHGLIIFWTLFAALYVAYFWVWYHVSMAMQSRNNKNFGAQTWLMETAWVIAWLIWPVFWWILADQYWSTMLYIATVVCLVVSCIPLLFNQKLHTPVIFHPNFFVQRVSQYPWLFKAVVISFSSMSYVYFIWSVVRSILLFSFLGTYTKIALISLISWICLLILFRIFGEQHDHSRGKMQSVLQRYLHVSFRSQSCTWFVAGVFIVGGFFSQLLFVFVDTFYKIAYRISDLSLMTYFYETIGEETNIAAILDSIFVRELAMSWSKIVFCCLLAAVTYMLQWYEYWWLIVALFLVIWVAPYGATLLLRKEKYASKKVSTIA